VTSNKDNDTKQQPSVSFGLIDDASMFLEMHLALLSFLETYERVYSPRGYQDAALAECAQAARHAVKELASHIQSDDSKPGTETNTPPDIDGDQPAQVPGSSWAT
jgi:hypothetical protein